MFNPGDLVTADFPGVTGIKRRPAVVVSAPDYHYHRPDVILGIIITKTLSATTPMDYVLQDWVSVGLHRASAFRSFFVTLPATAVSLMGHCSERDWEAIQICLTRAITTR